MAKGANATKRPSHRPMRFPRAASTVAAGLAVVLCAFASAPGASAGQSARLLVEAGAVAFSSCADASRTATAETEPETVGSADVDPAVSLSQASLALGSLTGSDEPVLFDALTGVERPLGRHEAPGVEEAIAAFRTAGYDVGFVVFDLAEQRGLGYNVDAAFFSASTVKAPFVASVLQGQVDVGRASMDDEMVQNLVAEGTGIMARDGRDRYDTRTVLANTIVHSDNTGYGLLRERFGSEEFESWCARAGVDAKAWDGAWYPRYSARELAELWVSMGTYLVDGDGSSRWLAERLSETSTSFLRDALGDRGLVLSKPGYETGSATMDVGALNDAGVVLVDGDAYVVAIMSDVDYDDEVLTDNGHLIVDLAKALGEARDEVLAVRSVA